MAVRDRGELRTRVDIAHEVGVGGSGGQRARRADAQRSIDAIIRSATELLSRDPDASLTDVARSAGIGRVTVYGHFPSRAALVAAAVEHAVHEAAVAMKAAKLDEGRADEALFRLLRMSWPIIDRHRALHAAAAALPPSQLPKHHRELVAQIEDLIRRGQSERAFRADLAPSWLAAVAYSLTHAAAEEVAAGRLERTDASAALEGTLRAVFGTGADKDRP